jgi:GNAT superfamily N-acetyltransferase
MTQSYPGNRITIRPAQPGDVTLILELIKGLAEYERAPEQAKATAQDIEKALFQPNPGAHALICSVDGQPAGFALYFYNFSTWTGKSGIYLEDLFIEPAYRGRGAGKALLKTLARIAVAEDCTRFEWSVLDWNEPAIRFYEAFGAEPQSEWIGYRLSGDALRAFADGSD